MLWVLRCMYVLDNFWISQFIWLLFLPFLFPKNSLANIKYLVTSHIMNFPFPWESRRGFISATLALSCCVLSLVLYTLNLYLWKGVIGSISEDNAAELQRTNLLFMKFSELVAFLWFLFCNNIRHVKGWF